jgi:orotate phosphoribosyltransferase
MQVTELKELKEQLLVLLNKEALKRGEFTLSSGKKSNYYLDGRIITLTPEGSYLVANIILELCREKNIKKIPIKTFIVRKAVKEHGTQRQIEGPALPKGSRVILVDDVATTGKALIEAKEALDKEGVLVDTAIVIVDRCEGAKENLEKAGLKLESIFNIKDFGL